MAEKAAEAEARGGASARARLGEGRRLSFDDLGPAAERESHSRGGGVGEDGGESHERRVRSSLAAEFDELRPFGAETMPAAEVVRALEAELGGRGRVTAALAEAAGRPAAATALNSADSAPAIRAAAREWREVWARVSAERGERERVGPPAD
eukprot:2676851-Pleurochrysis_carterae.AAC.1